MGSIDMANEVSAQTVKGWLSEAREIAFLDIREHGQYGEGHPFFAIPLPYSVLELRLPVLVPNLSVRLVLLDDGDGVGARAARRAEALGYRDVNVLAGGAPGWRTAGFTLFAGVNVPSKTFGEIIEHERHTPRITAAELADRQRRGERMVIVDGRPFAEFQKMNIPGGVCCPNGELAVRIDELVSDPTMPIVVNCAGRTRSIIGAETLRTLGLANPVVALENGTQGWFLAGLKLENGSDRQVSEARPDAARLAPRRERLRAIAKERGARFATADAVAGWMTESERTTYLLDVRTAAEVASRPVPAAVHAPGGQLIQATDQWVGVKGARLVIIDDDGVRAPMVAQWLAQLGHDAWVLDGGVAAAERLSVRDVARSGIDPVPRVAIEDVGALLRGGALLVDLRASAAYKSGHIDGASWCIRPRLGRLGAGQAGRVLMLAGDAQEVALAAVDLSELGWLDIRHVGGDAKVWREAGLAIVPDRGTLADSERIDFLFFVHDRHEGNAAAARRYLEWETGLLAQLDAQERGAFRVAG